MKQTTLDLNAHRTTPRPRLNNVSIKLESNAHRKSPRLDPVLRSKLG